MIDLNPPGRPALNTVKYHTPAVQIRSGLCGLWFALVLLSAVPTAAQEEPTTLDGPVYEINQFVLLYGAEHPDHPPLSEFLPLEVQLGDTPSGFVAPREDVAAQVVTIADAVGPARAFHASAIGSINRAVIQSLQGSGLIGVYVSPHPSDVDGATEADLRRPGDTLMRLVVQTGQLRRIRTVAAGDRIDADWVIDNKIHRPIRLDSPLQPASNASPGTSDLLRKDTLQNYLYALNRHPGRQVEASLAPSEGGKGVDLDYHVNESRSWFAYLQTSNTGTKQTARWQNRIGFVDQQLTNRDDILALEYMNAGLDRVHAVRGSYEAPFFGPRRPSWLKRSGKEPGWLAWFNRDKIPWWGVDRLRWRLDGSWSQFKATGVQKNTFEGRNWTASGTLIYNVWQYENLFVDISVDLGGRGIETTNNTFGKTANAMLFLPGAGLQIEKIGETSSLEAEIGFSASVIPLSRYDAANMGRFGADESWQILGWNAILTQYLEPLLYRQAWLNPETPSTSTLAQELALGLRGQYSFGHRLIPQVTQVIGGLYSVRGYPQSTAVGDDVYIGTAEYRLHIPRLFPIHKKPAEIPLIGRFSWAPQQPYGRADWDLILRVFVDAGYTRQNPPPNGVQIPSESNQLLIGTGVGLELQIMNHIHARVDAGWALHDSNDPVQPVRVGHNEVYFQFSIVY